MLGPLRHNHHAMDKFCRGGRRGAQLVGRGNMLSRKTSRQQEGNVILSSAYAVLPQKRRDNSIRT